jgi:hypothetical protein
MMALLPPVGWADVATKHDLDQAVLLLRTEMDLRFEAMEHKLMSTFERGLKDLSTRFFLGLLASNATLAGLAFGAARLMS